MNPDEVDPRIQGELRNGESLIWWGVPEPRAYSRAMRPVFWFGIPWTLFALFWIAAASLMLGMGGDGMKDADGPMIIFRFFPLFGIPFVLIGIGMLTSPFWVRRLARRACYGLTDQRVIIRRHRWLSGIEVRSYTSEQLGKMVRREFPDGTGDLIFEQYVEHGTDSDGHRTTRTIEHGITGIEDVRNVEKLIRAALLGENP